MVWNDQNTAWLCRSLELLLRSGVPPAEGCFLLAQEVPDPLLTRLAEALDAGQPLSDALEASGAFPGSLPALIRVGETTGRLEEALGALADHHAYRHRTSRQLRQALTYPCLILLLMLGVIGVLLVKVLPVFQQVYASLGGSLTGAALWLLALGRGLQRMLPALLGIAVLAAASVLVLSRSKNRSRTAAFLARRFGDRGFLRQFNNARFARGLAMGLASGSAPEEAARLARLLLQEIPGAAQRCDRLEAALESGTELSAALEMAGLITAAHSRLLAVGIRSGSGDRIMGEVARRMEEEAIQALETLLSRIEPTMVLCASFLVGGILLTVMLPLMNILTVLG